MIPDILRQAFAGGVDACECGERFTTYEFTIDQLSVIMGRLFGRNLAASAGLAAGEAVNNTLREMAFQSENIIKALKEYEE